MDDKNTTLSIVTPVWNEGEGVESLLERVLESASRCGVSWECVLVNDGSSDATLEKALAWHRRDPRVKVLDLSRRFGHQAALLAGIAHARGEFVACIDGDLQDPPELIPVMLAELRKQNADVAYGVRKSRKEGCVKKSAYWTAYRLMRGLMDIDLPLDAGDFALMRRPVVDAVLRMPEQALFLRGLRAWVGFRQIAIEYERAARFSGESKYRWRDLFRLAYNGIFSFTKIPIRLLGAVGFFAILVSVTYSGYLAVNWLIGNPIPRGFPTIMLAIIFFSGVQLVALRILGSYIHRIYDEVRGRPLYLVRTFWNGGPLA